jgi:hypothetical protein
MRAPMPPTFGQEPPAGERGQGHGARLLRTLQAHGLPLHATALGKAVLAYLPADVRADPLDDRLAS